MTGTTSESETVHHPVIPGVIADFYTWAEEASIWQVAMYRWAEKLKEELETRNLPLADPPPIPPKRWP